MSETLTTAAGLALAHATLTSPPIHIPDDAGGSFKTELVISRDPDLGTEKIFWWHADDPRKTPHNHPWYFESTIEAGGYTEYRYWRGEYDDVIGPQTVTYRAGDVNSVSTDVFHVVRDVLPGTRTRLKCGPAAANNEWGYLNTSTGKYTRAPKDEAFINALLNLNPHLRTTD